MTRLYRPPSPHQTALKDMFGAALLVSLVRIGAIYVGSWLGCYVTSTSTEFRRSFWMSMVTQVCVCGGGEETRGHGRCVCGGGEARDDTGRHGWSAVQLAVASREDGGCTIKGRFPFVRNSLPLCNLLPCRAALNTPLPLCRPAWPWAWPAWPARGAPTGGRTSRPSW